MKHIYFPVCSVLIVITLFSCKKSPVSPITSPIISSGDWAIGKPFSGPARSEAVSFVIDNIAYVGTGWDGLNTRYNDFWKYDPANRSWTQVASMPAGTERSSAIGFSANGNGYVGTGYDGTHYLNDFYKYDPTTDVWTKKASFGGSARYEAVAFSIGNFGYVGTGFDGTNAVGDFYRYDPSSDSWTGLGFNGNARFGAVAWTYNNQGYIATGINNGVLQTDFWVFDPADKGQWTSLKPIYNFSKLPYDDAYTTIARWNAVAFVIGNQAYVSTGENGESGENNLPTWEYDMTIGNGSRLDIWTEKTPFEGSPTTGATGFSLDVENGSGGFLTTGRTTPGQAGASNQFWQFFPALVMNPNDN